MAIILFVYIGCSIPAAAQQVLFISPSGNDANKGTIQSPFKTIDHAKEKARNTRGKVTVYLRGGYYCLSAPVVFDEHDSRNNKEPIVYKSYNHEPVVIGSAAEQHLVWKKYNDSLFIAPIDPSLVWDQLFVNGVQQRMARYPNYDSSAAIFHGFDSNAIAVNRINGWKNPAGGYLHAMHRSEWGSFHFRITGKDANGKLSLEGGWQNNRQSGLHASHLFIENIFEELDAVHEWYVSSAQALLYYFPGNKTIPVNTVIQSPQLKHLIEFKGTAGKPVRNITIEGITFTHTVRSFMDTKEPLLRSDWTIYRGGAILLTGTQHCIIRQCGFTDLGGNAVFFSGYNQYDSVSNCLFENIGASAICFVGDTNAVRSPLFEYHQSLSVESIDKKQGPRSDSYPRQCVAYDNLIHDIGTIEKQVAGVQISMSQEITVSHCTIYNLPRSGINIGDGNWGGHVIEYNDVFNTVLETGDHGAFNAWGRDRFWHPSRDTMNKITLAMRDSLVLLDAMKTTVIRNNRFRCDHGWDIDLDDGASNYHIYNNVLLNGGLKLREGFFRVVENNIIINNSFHPHVWFNNSEDIFRHNIVTTGYYPIRISTWGKEVDHNIFLDSIGLINAQKEGHDKSSVFARDAIVKNKQSYELNRKYRSKNLAVIDQQQFGVVSKRLKLKADSPVLPALYSSVSPGNAGSFEVFGLVVKNVLAGERSATGMDAERGVYVTEIKASSPFAKIMRPNDVLLMINNNQLNDIRDFLSLKAILRFNRPFALQVFRDQRLQELTYTP